MLKSDQRELRNSKVKFKWVVVGGGMRGLQRQGWTLSIDPDLICMKERGIGEF